MFTKTGMIITLLTAIALLSLNEQAVSKTVDQPAKIIASTKSITIVSIPSLSFEDLAYFTKGSFPNIQYLLQNSAIGAMNARTPIRGAEHSYLSLGAGATAISVISVQALNRNEPQEGQPSGKWYERYQGKDPSSADVLVPEIAAIRNLNQSRSNGAHAGLLGETLRHYGVSVSVYGNSDMGFGEEYLSPTRKKRYAPFMLMDEQGRVGQGDVSTRTLISSTRHPYNVRTNYDYLFQRLEEAPGRSVVLLELGDWDRLYAEKKMYNQTRFLDLKQVIAAELDQFVGRIIQRINNPVYTDHESQESHLSDTLWLLSPIVNSEAMNERSMLVPVLLFQKGIEQGLLTSSSTRRKGIIANHDIAPSLLNELQIQTPAEMIGLPLNWEPQKDNLKRLSADLRTIQNVYKLRPVLLYSFVIYEVVVLLVSLLFVLLNWNPGLKWMAVPLYSLLAAPLIMLWMGLIAGKGIVGMSIFFVVALVVIAWWLNRRSLFLSLSLIGLISGGMIVLDGLTGALAMKSSILGYDPMIGARYYGIGNEYMGVLIGSLILGTSVFLQVWVWKYKKRLPTWLTWLISFLLLGVIYYMAAPNLGADAGGALTGVVAFGFLGVRVFGGKRINKIRWTYFIGTLFILFLVVIGILWLLNTVMFQGIGGQSHVGRAMGQLMEGRWDIIWRMVVRKLEMNWHLIGVSSWSKVLLSSLFVIAMIVLRPWGIFREWQERYPLIMYGFAANTIGAFAGLAFNDSGIVAAATMIVYVAVPMLLLKVSVSRSSQI